MKEESSLGFVVGARLNGYRRSHLIFEEVSGNIALFLVHNWNLSPASSLPLKRKNLLALN